MRGITKVWIGLSLLVLLASIGFVIYLNNGGKAPSLPRNTEPDPEQAIREAVQTAVEANRESILGFMIYEVEVNNIVYSDDKRTALVWLAQRDPETGDIIGREPGLAIARNTQGALAQADGWQIAFEVGQKPLDLNTLPPELVDEELRARFSLIQEAQSATAPTYTGYKLPWSTALRIRITGSVGHFLDYNSCSETSCRYAYDFWNPDPNNRNFPLLASKGGVVQAYRESCQNGDSQCANYIVLRDDSTSPATYQLYYHIAHNSVPDNLQAGTYVQQGEYIANVDDTGYSTGPHLHFHVYANRIGSYSWGNSVRIIFQDVPFNGGEPRTCAETVNHPGYGTECAIGPDGKKLTKDDNYLQSGNTGAYPPTGSLDAPAEWSTVTNGTLTVSGRAADNQGIARVEILLNWDGTWKTVGDATYANGSFQGNVNMCSIGVPSGPLSLAVRIWDVEGNWVSQYTGIRQIFNNSDCAVSIAPVPACTPASTEVALYTGANYTGTCRKFGAGYYNTSALGALGDNTIQSIQVGTGVRAVLFDRNEDLNLGRPLGRLETFTASDANLGDNRLASNMTSALWVNGSASIADASVIEPFLTFPGNRFDPDNNSTVSNPANPTSNDSLVLAWTGGKGATYFTSTLTRSGVSVGSMPSTKTQTWSVGSLSPGNYTWTVTACSAPTSCTGGVTNSTTINFTVDPATLPTAGAAAIPTTTYTFEQGGQDWTGSGLWRLGDVNRLQADLSTAPTRAWIFNNGSNTADPAWKAGDLTSPPFTVAATGAQFLRFRYFSGVEGGQYAGQTVASNWWDQRRVQVSVNGGAFKDVTGGMLTQDIQNRHAYWPAVAFNLGTFNAGQVIRVRFHYDSVDAVNNGVFGWAVDDIQVSTVPFDPGCRDNNDTPSTAIAIKLGEKKGERICPLGDVDLYSFQGTAGMNLAIDLDAKSLDPNNPLDGFVTLLDATGLNVVAANDDENATNPEARFRDPYLTTQLPYTGTYYIQVKAWNHPGGGGPEYAYNVTVNQAQPSNVRPTVTWKQPPDITRLPGVPFIVEAAASDPSGIRRVDFFWHSADWVNGKWQLFASDTTPAEGWFGIFNPTMDTTGSAFYIMATSNSGATNGVYRANAAPDRLAPSTRLDALPVETLSTAVQLTWSAVDLQNDLAYFDLQYRFNGGAWAGIPNRISGGARSAWFIGQAGRYEFKIRGVDAAGNAEPFAAAAAAATTLNPACAVEPGEPANNAASGAVLLPYSQPVSMSQCKDDPDWAAFDAKAGQELMLYFRSDGGGAAVRVNIYDPGQKLIAQAQAAQIGQTLMLRFRAPVTGRYLLEMNPLQPAVYGSGVRYSVYAGKGNWLYFPVIGR